MRISRLAAVLFVLAAGAFGVGPASAVADMDWFQVKVVAGPQGADFDIDTFFTAFSGGDGPLVSGFGYSRQGWGGAIVVDMGGGKSSLTTTRDYGGLHVNAVRTGSRVDSSAFISFPSMPPGESASLLMFAPNVADFRAFRSVRFHNGSGDVQVTSGSGSAVVEPVTSDSTGRALELASVAAGDAVHTTEQSTAIVGAMVADCVKCDGGWTSPDGRTRDFSNISVPVVLHGAGGAASFAGPPGTWQWRWSGVRAVQNDADDPNAPPALAAFAPIGDDWVLYKPGFQGEPPPPGPPLPPPSPVVDDLRDGSSWVACTLNLDANAELRVAAKAEEIGAPVVAVGVWLDQGYGLKLAGDGRATTTTVQAGGMRLLDDSEAIADDPYGLTYGFGVGADPIAGFKVLAAVAANGPTKSHIVMTGPGVHAESCTEGTSASLQTDREFASGGAVSIHRPVTVNPVVDFLLEFVGVEGAGSSAVVGGSWPTTIDRQLYGWFGSFDTAVLVADTPSGMQNGEQVFSGAESGDYEFSTLAAASPGPFSAWVFAADVNPPW